MARLSSSLRPWRRLGRRPRRWLVLAIAIAAGVGTALADVSPTAEPVADTVLAFLAGAGITWVVARARRWALPILAAGAAFLATDQWLVMGLVALALALLGLGLERRDRVVGAIVGGLAVQCLFRLPTHDYGFAVPTLVAAAALFPAFLSTAWNADRGKLKVAGLAAVGLALVVGVVGTLTALAALDAEDSVNEAIAASRTALAQIRNDERQAAAGSFGDAAALFGDARDAMGGPVAQAGRWVPIVGQHVESVETLAGAGRNLALTSAQTIETLDLDGLEFQGGRIDLARVSALAEPAQAVVTETEETLATIDAARSPWLVPMLSERIDDLAAELDAALPGARTTVAATRVAPTLLGAEEAMTYLVLFVNPAEGRELGGFTGNAGVLIADDGRLDYQNIDTISDLNDDLEAIDATLPDDVELTSAYLATQPDRFPQNWSETADFPTVAAVASHTLEQVRPGLDIDGVLLFDPYALAAVLELSGPVDLPGLGVTISADNAVDFLLRDQYLLFDLTEQGERKELLRDVGEAAFDRLTSGILPAPTVVAQTLGPLVDERRLLAVVDDPDGRTLLDDLGLTGEVDVRSEPGDEVISVVESNIRANKLDAYIHRTIDLDGRVIRNGEFRGTLTLGIENRVPTTPLNTYVLGDGGEDIDGLPETSHWMFATVYSTIPITAATLNGQDVALAAEPAYGMTRSTVLVLVAQGETAEVAFTLAGGVDAARFALHYVPYPAANPEVRDIRVATP